MPFYFDKEKAKLLELLLLDYYEKEKIERGDELHVYDLSYCLLKAHHRLTGDEKNYTKQDVGYLVSGTIGQTILQALFPESAREREVNYQYNTTKVFGHVDIFADAPYEIKMTRRTIFKRDQIPQQWITQLSNYIAFTHSTMGWLIVYNMISNQIACFRLELSEREILQLHEINADKIGRLIGCKGTNNINSLIIYANFDECPTCHYRKICPKYRRRKKGEKKQQTQAQV